MTGTEFNAEFKMGQRIATGGVETFLAHGTPTRRLVMVHRLAGATAGERRRINSLLDALPTRGTTVLSRVDVDGEPVVVTEFLPDFVTLRDWLEAAVAVQTTVVIRTGAPEPPAAPPPPPASQPAPDDGPGEFTRMFGQAATPPPAAAPTPLPVAPPVASPHVAAPSPMTPPASPPPAPAWLAPTATPHPLPPSVAEQSPAPQPGSFTALFGAPLAPSDAAGGSPPVAPPEPPVAAPTPREAPHRETAPRPAPPPPGEFTRMFGASSAPVEAGAHGQPPRLDLSPPAPVASSAAGHQPPLAPPPYAPPVAPPPYAPPLAPPAPPLAPSASAHDNAGGDAPKIRVAWRPRSDSAPASQVGATGAMQPAAVPHPPAMQPPLAPPAAPPLPPAFASPLSPLMRAEPGSLGPPELRLYGNEAAPSPTPYAPPSSMAPPPRAAGPSDFTRMLTPIEAPSAAPAAPAVRPNAKPDAAAGARKPSALPLIIVLIVALITAAALILYFALRG